MFFENPLFVKIANPIPIAGFSKDSIITRFFKRLRFLTGEKVEGFFS
jgi:hypothetical protein